MGVVWWVEPVIGCGLVMGGVYDMSVVLVGDGVSDWVCFWWVESVMVCGSGGRWGLWCGCGLVMDGLCDVGVVCWWVE